MPQLITMKDILTAARKRIKNGTLQAQYTQKYYKTTGKALRVCNYQDGNVRCVIGAAMSKETIDKILKCAYNVKGIYYLIENKEVEVRNNEEIDIIKLQDKHDDWVCEPETDNTKKEFYEFFHEMERKYLNTPS